VQGEGPQSSGQDFFSALWCGVDDFLVKECSEERKINEEEDATNTETTPWAHHTDAHTDAKAPPAAMHGDMVHQRKELAIKQKEIQHQMASVMRDLEKLERIKEMEPRVRAETQQRLKGQLVELRNKSDIIRQRITTNDRHAARNISIQRATLAVGPRITIRAVR
jgi:hypothetical protein